MMRKNNADEQMTVVEVGGGDVVYKQRLDWERYPVRPVFSCILALLQMVIGHIDSVRANDLVICVGFITFVHLKYMEFCLYEHII